MHYDAVGVRKVQCHSLRLC